MAPISSFRPPAPPAQTSSLSSAAQPASTSGKFEEAVKSTNQGASKGGAAGDVIRRENSDSFSDVQKKSGGVILDPTDLF